MHWVLQLRMQGDSHSRTEAAIRICARLSISHLVTKCAAHFQHFMIICSF